MRCSLPKSSLARSAPVKAALLFPLLALEDLNPHVASPRWLVRSPAAQLPRTGVLLLTVHLVAYLGGALFVLSPVKGLAFMAVHQAVFGPAAADDHLPKHPRRRIRHAPRRQPRFAPPARPGALLRRRHGLRHVREPGLRPACPSDLCVLRR
jgi:hypothetical protein